MLYTIYIDFFIIKIDLHPPGTPKPSKNTFLLQQNQILEGFSVPGGCKSILIIKTLHIYIVYNKKFWTEGFIFLGGSKK